MSEAPPLEEQESHGLFFEEVEKIVDGVVSDIAGGRVDDYVRANFQADGAVYASVYATDFEFALVALKHACPAHARQIVLKLAVQVLEAEVRKRLAGTEEYRALKKKKEKA